MNVEPLTVLLIIVVLLGALAVVGHLIARHTWPVRRAIWRHRAEVIEEEAKEIGDEYVLEKPEAGMDTYEPEHVAAAGDPHDARAEQLEIRARQERLDAERAEAEARRLRQTAPAEPERGERVPGERAEQDALTRLRRRRAAGISQEDLDY